MTLDMILALGVLAFMIILMMTEKLGFGAPPLLACLLLVVFGLSTVPEAFAGFANSTVIMIAGFMVVMAGLLKTSFIARLQATLVSLVEKGGFKSYALLVILVMLGASIMGTGATGYYVMLIPLVAAIPYNKALPTSKLVMPLGFASNHPLIPLNVALQYGVLISVLETSGIRDNVTVVNLATVSFFVSLAYLIWSLVAFPILPDHEIEIEGVEDTKEEAEEKGSLLSSTQERITVIAFFISVIGMMFMDYLGDVAYVIPFLAGFVILAVDVLDFDEFRNHMMSPIVVLTAGVIGVADALGKTGFSNLIGDFVADNLANNLSPVLLVLIFAILTSATATLTGSTIGTIYIFAPIAVATFQSLGLSPLAAASAIVLAGWNGHFLPLDGLPAMLYGAGQYKITEFWKYSLPMYFIRIIGLTIGAMIVFPF